MRRAQCRRTTELLCLFNRVFLVRFDSHIYRRAETRGPGRRTKAGESQQEDPRPAPYHQAVQPLRRQGRRGHIRCVLPLGCWSVSHTRAL
jgi:hypothetical protein